MALRETAANVACAFRGASTRRGQSLWQDTFRRRASTAATAQEAQIAAYDVRELETTSTFEGNGVASDYNPVLRAQQREEQLPSSRYKFRPPRYYRGPLHPHQPPPKTDIASREFRPGPFSSPRLAQTYTSTIAPDYMTLAYQHYPPGYEPAPKAPRLRSWDDSSPYHKNRPLRGPRGGDFLRLIRKPIGCRNIPRLTGVTVHTFSAEASQDSGRLHVMSMAVQAITGVRPVAHRAKTNVADWGLRAGRYASVTADLRGEDMFNFLAKMVDVVMPRIKEWSGVAGTSGDGSGNISFGFGPDEVAYFPEIEVNYDSYPPKMIPGCNVTVKTSATNDRDARLLLMCLGIPFHGKMVN
ncbi:MAG: hypothetical protein Q9162_003737 [Coniocarpon cinnabarinum]